MVCGLWTTPMVGEASVKTVVMDLLGRQRGIITRAQALEHGVSPQVLRGRVERGDWQRLYPGVYAAFSGEVAWEQRAWAAVLVCGDGAALGFQAAAYAGGFRIRPPHVFEVLVPPGRKVARRPRLRVHRRVGLDQVIRGWPPRTIEAQTVLDLASRSRDATDVVGILTAGLRAGASQDDVSTLLGRVRQHRWRTLLADVLKEAEEGVESPLEWRYRRDVERRHGLPAARLQVVERLPFGVIRADARYRRFSTRVELDGALAHPGGRTDKDTWRDNEVAITSSELTLRYRWVHVAGVPCRTAVQVGRALRRGGWHGTPSACRTPGCAVAGLSARFSA